MDLVEARVEELVFEKTGTRPKCAGGPHMDISPGHFLPAGHDRAIPAAYGCARHMDLWGAEQRTELELARKALLEAEILHRFGEAHDWDTYPDMTVSELVEMVEKKNRA